MVCLLKFTVSLTVVVRILNPAFKVFLAKGVEASYKLAENDLTRMGSYKYTILKVGSVMSMDPAVIAAIISRESRAGAALVNGWGDHGNGFGLMQVCLKSEYHIQLITRVYVVLSAVVKFGLFHLLQHCFCFTFRLNDVLSYER